MPLPCDVPSYQGSPFEERMNAFHWHSYESDFADKNRLNRNYLCYLPIAATIPVLKDSLIIETQRRLVCLSGPSADSRELECEDSYQRCLEPPVLYLHTGTVWIVGNHHNVAWCAGHLEDEEALVPF